MYIYAIHIIYYLCTRYISVIMFPHGVLKEPAGIIILLGISAKRRQFSKEDDVRIQ